MLRAFGKLREQGANDRSSGANILADMLSLLRIRLQKTDALIGAVDPVAATNGQRYIEVLGISKKTCGMLR